MPVAAVKNGGKPSVKHGSQIATAGIRYGERKPSFRSSFMVIKEARPTSLPVPAVVGTAISGSTSALILATPPSIAAYWRNGAGWLKSKATALAKSMLEPPPTATMPSHSLSRRNVRACSTAASVGLEGVPSKTQACSFRFADSITCVIRGVLLSPLSVTNRGLFTLSNCSSLASSAIAFSPN